MQGRRPITGNARNAAPASARSGAIISSFPLFFCCPLFGADYVTRGVGGATYACSPDQARLSPGISRSEISGTQSGMLRYTLATLQRHADGGAQAAHRAGAQGYVAATAGRGAAGQGEAGGARCSRAGGGGGG